MTSGTLIREARKLLAAALHASRLDDLSLDHIEQARALLAKDKRSDAEKVSVQLT